MDSLNIPQTELGQPEAGLQLDIFGKTHEVRPAGKGLVTQQDFDDYQKLLKAMKGKGEV